MFSLPRDKREGATGALAIMHIVRFPAAALALLLLDDHRPLAGARVLFRGGDLVRGAAHDLGVVIGSSHCDMLLRSNEHEFEGWAAYDYSLPGRNRDELIEYYDADPDAVEVTADKEEEQIEETTRLLARENVTIFEGTITQ